MGSQDPGKESEMAKEEAPKSFVQMLAQIGDGEAEAVLSRELYELARELREQAVATMSEKKGTITLTIKLCIDKAAQTMAADYEVKTKEPQPPRQGSLFFFDRGGNWCRNNPRQQDLPLRAVPDGAGTNDIREPAII
jgi:hypothetical protein